jgi:hypothetical protein
MKLVKSDCGRAWFFDAREEGGILHAGFACFLSRCSQQILVSMGKEKVALLVPQKATNSPVPVRIINARLSVLSGLA